MVGGGFGTYFDGDRCSVVHLAFNISVFGE